MTELLKFSPTVGFAASRPPDSFPCRPRQTKINAVFHCYQSQKLGPWEPTDNPSTVQWPPLDYRKQLNIHFYGS